jgi:hypothetical protein
MLLENNNEVCKKQHVSNQIPEHSIVHEVFSKQKIIKSWLARQQKIQKSHQSAILISKATDLFKNTDRHLFK